MGEVANILRGASPRPIKDPKWFDSNSKIGWIRISDVTNQHGRIYNLEQHLSKAGQDKTRVVYPPSLLLSIAASVGYPVITYIETGVHDGFVILDKPKFNLDFMFFKLQQIQKTWNKYGQPGSQININSSIVSNTKILIPTNNEQLQISNILKKIEKCIHLQQRKADDYFQYKTQLINTIFANKNWQIIKLRDVLSVPKEELANVTTKSQIMTVKLNLGGVINGANRDTLNLSATKYYIRHAGQFIFGKQNFFNGSMAIIPKAMDGKVTSQDVPALNINNEKINSKFLLYYLSRRNFYKHTERFATGTGSKRLHVDTLLNLKIRIPDISYQNQIVSTLTLLDKKLQLETAKLNKLKQLKHFLLQNMFI